MKLNKFLVAAAAVAVLPLSVANAAEEAPVLEKPILKVNPDGSTEELPSVTAKGTPETGDAKVDFNGAVNGPGLVQPELKPYGTSLVAPEVHTKPEYKAPKSQGTFKVDKGTEAGKSQNGQKVLPKTSAVK